MTVGGFFEASAAVSIFASEIWPEVIAIGGIQLEHQALEKNDKEALWRGTVEFESSRVFLCPEEESGIFLLICI